MIKALIEYFKKSPEEVKNKNPEGFCPNCWGQQEYDQTVREMYIDKQIDVNNHETNHAFIQQFVVEKVNGIHLKKGKNGMECPTCKINY